MTAIALHQQQEPSERLYLVEEEEEEEDYDVHWKEVNAEFDRHQDSSHENSNNNDDDDDNNNGSTQQQYRHVSFDFEEIDDMITIRTVTNAGQSTGLAVWTCGQILSGYLLDHKQYIQNCQRGVLELGAGAGLCSITAHKLGAKHVIATDGDVDVLHNLRYNVQQNKNTTIAQTAGVATTTTTFSCPQLVWGQELETFRRVHGPASVILATDVFYAAHLVQPLWQTVHALLTTSLSEGHFFLAYCPHAVSVDVVLDAAQTWGFTWACPNITTSNCDDDDDNHDGKEEVFNDIFPNSSDFGYHIFHFKRKAEQSATW